MNGSNYSAARVRGAMGGRDDYKCSTNEPGSSTEERFPQSESWWQPTDTRKEWGAPDPLLVDGYREKTPVALMSSYIEPQSRVNEQEQTKKENSKDILEIMLVSTRKYYSQRSDIKIGSVIVEEIHYVNDVKSRIFYINCSPDRFDVLERYCKDTLLYEPDFETSDESEDDYVRVTKMKTVQRVHGEQYEETTEHKYCFPKSAKLTFYIA